MPQPHILSVLNEGVLTLTIERPEALNALNSQIIEELSEALDLAQTNEKVQVMILTGSGSKAFVAGADIKEFADFSAKQGKRIGPKRPRESVQSHRAKCQNPSLPPSTVFALGGWAGIGPRKPRPHRL